MQGAIKRGWGRIARWLGAAAALITCALLVGFGAFLTHITPQRLHVAGFAPGLDLLHPSTLEVTLQSAPADAIVVLTGGGARLDEAARLFKAGHARRLLISGVNGKTSREELRRRLDISQARFDCCVDIGYEAQDTIGNAVETQKWCALWKHNRIILVTANYHMPRSLLEFAHALPNAEIVPHTVTPRPFAEADWWLSANTMSLAGGEYLKFLGAHIRIAGARVLEAGAPRGNSNPRSVPSGEVAGSKLEWHSPRL
jgi:uncharacterized SAM-binding protein YcdF (DUF218 family)